MEVSEIGVKVPGSSEGRLWAPAQVEMYSNMAAQNCKSVKP